MQKTNFRMMLLALLAVFAISVLTPLASLASTKGRRNTAIALTGVAAYSLIRGHNTTGFVTGAGAAYAWSRYKDSKESDRDRSHYYNTRGGRSYSDSRWDRDRDRRDDKKWDRDRDRNNKKCDRYHDNGRRVGSRQCDNNCR